MHDSQYSLVTAVVTTHNRAPHMVLRAVDSALGQTYPEIEIVVVDDSDADYPMRDEVERSVRKRSELILYVRHESHRGANAARNTGLAYAHGSYVAFLDDDDEWYPQKIERQMECFADEDICLVYCRCRLVYEIDDVSYVPDTRFFSGNVFEELMKRNFIGGTSNPVLRKEFVDEVGGFDELMESCQDYDLWLRMAQNYAVDYVDEPLLNYYFHEGAHISNNPKAKIAGLERINMKYGAWIRRERFTQYMRLRVLVPFQLAAYGRGRAFGTWTRCVALQPLRVWRNTKHLVMIAIGSKSNMKLTAVRRKIRYGVGQGLRQRLVGNG